jgi:hypothetical protein
MQDDDIRATLIQPGAHSMFAWSEGLAPDPLVE